MLPNMGRTFPLSLHQAGSGLVSIIIITPSFFGFGWPLKALTVRLPFKEGTTLLLR